MKAVADLAATACRWMIGVDHGDRVVVSSRVRLARNLHGQPFKRIMDRDQQHSLVGTILSLTGESLGWDTALACRMDELSDIERRALSERHLISRELAQGDDPAGVVVRADESASLMINEEDHVRLQVIRPGLAVDQVLAEAIDNDRRLERILDWAVDDDYGYLTSCPTNIGTGLRLSAMLHLPALSETKELAKVLNAAGKLHMAVRGLFGEGSEASGCFYQVSNQRTLGVSEDEIAANLSEVLQALVTYETMARAALMKNRRYLVEDKACRAWGVLTQARSLSSNELMEHLSWLRLGMDRQLIDFDDWAVVDRLFVHSQPAHMTLLHPESDDPEVRDRLRADMVRRALSQDPRSS